MATKKKKRADNNLSIIIATKVFFCAIFSRRAIVLVLREISIYKFKPICADEKEWRFCI